LNAIKKKYEKEIGLMLDEDRAYILERFDSRFQSLVSGEDKPEDNNTPPKDNETEPPSNGHQDLAKKEEFSKTFTKQAVAEMSACGTISDLQAWRKKNLDSIYKCLKEYSEYLKQYYATRWNKVSGNGTLKSDWK
jgi:hypothetical protein